jgi:hypothetical protein
LCAETPYTPLEVLDWVSQAQLAMELGPQTYKQLRDVGIRNIFALEKAADNQELTNFVIDIIYKDKSSRPKDIKAIIDPIMNNVHVGRLRQIHDVLQEVYAKKT